MWVDGPLAFKVAVLWNFFFFYFAFILFDNFEGLFGVKGEFSLLSSLLKDFRGSRLSSSFLDCVI